MTGMTKYQVIIIKAKVDMFNLYTIMMNKIYDDILMLYPDLYIVSNPTPTVAPTEIRIQIVWNSITAAKYVSFSRLIKSSENYQKTLYEINVIFAYALQDSYKLGDSPFESLLK